MQVTSVPVPTSADLAAKCSHLPSAHNFLLLIEPSSINQHTAAQKIYTIFKDGKGISMASEEVTRPRDDIGGAKVVMVWEEWGPGCPQSHKVNAAASSTAVLV